jgi:lycopene beta-cyclase
MNKSYEYIIAGGGLAGLTLAIKLTQSKKLSGKSILILDKDSKTSNDRTWSFWTRKESDFDPIITQKWSQAIVKDENKILQLNLDPYTYQTIQAKSFYAFCKEKLAKFKNVVWKRETILNIDALSGKIQTTEGVYKAQVIFDSTYNKESFKVKSNSLLLWQHFKGEIIETKEPAFDSQLVTLMDFNTNQHGQTRFFYVLPFSKNKALIEYTVFSKKVLPEVEYDPFLEQYKKSLGVKNHQILETEYSAIPMTDQVFRQTKGKVVFIGTKGGFIKASSGYGFAATQRKIDLIVHQLENGTPIRNLKHSSQKKFRFYDAVLLHALDNPVIHSPDLFLALFNKIGAANLFSFLDEETHLLEDLQVIMAVPNKYKLTFLKYLHLWTRVSEI